MSWQRTNAMAALLTATSSSFRVAAQMCTSMATVLDTLKKDLGGTTTPSKDPLSYGPPKYADLAGVTLSVHWLDDDDYDEDGNVTWQVSGSGYSAQDASTVEAGAAWVSALLGAAQGLIDEGHKDVADKVVEAAEFLDEKLET
jgi:hypothetical protein